MTISFEDIEMCYTVSAMIETSMPCQLSENCGMVQRSSRQRGNPLVSSPPNGQRTLAF